MKSMKDIDFPGESMGMITLGERGQVVIPAQVRERFDLSPGDRLMVFTKSSSVICMVPASSMRHLVDVLNNQLAENDTDPDARKNQ
jgi:AbrB family looped-hinge helix DNA binding protein